MLIEVLDPMKKYALLQRAVRYLWVQGRPRLKVPKAAARLDLE